MPGAQHTLAVALKLARLIQDPEHKNPAYAHAAVVQAKSGDVAGALITCDNILDADTKDDALARICDHQTAAGDIAGAQNTAHLIREDLQPRELADIAELYIKSRSSKVSTPTSVEITRHWIDPWPTAPSYWSDPILIESSANPRPIVLISVALWLQSLENGDTNGLCPLNTDLFLDFSGFVKSLPQSENPQWLFFRLRDTAKKIAETRNFVQQMLKEQAKQQPTFRASEPAQATSNKPTTVAQKISDLEAQRSELELEAKKLMATIPTLSGNERTDEENRLSGLNELSAQVSQLLQELKVNAAIKDLKDNLQGK